MKMMFVIACSVVAILSGCASSKEVRTPQRPSVKSGYADVNGIKMYYEIHGEAAGTPLILIHGGGSSIDVTWSKMLPFLSENRKVIAIDEQAHGRSSDRNAPVNFEQTADDVAALLKSLKIDKVDVMGFSNGASNAMQLTIRHPEMVRKLVHISAFTKRSGAVPGFFDYMMKADFSNMPQPLKDAFLKINPDPAKLKNMHDKDAARMRGFKDISDKKIRGIKVPTLIVQGDQDNVQLEHSIALNKMIKDSRLLILPGGHGDFLGDAMSQGETQMPKLTSGLINEFLGAP